MTSSTTHTTRTGPVGGKIVTAFGLSLALAAMSAAPASGAEGHHGPSPQQNARSHEAPHGANHQGGYRNQHDAYYRGGPSYYHGVYHDPYVYAPPPVAYLPEPTPGISLVFPLQFR